MRRITAALIALLLAGGIVGGVQATPANAETANVGIGVDSYVDQANPTTNYGTLANLNVDTGKITYLRFNLGAYAGKDVTSATLRLHTVNGSFAGSSATQAVHVAGDSWTEAGLTYDNRPAYGGGIGTLGPTVPDTDYAVTLDPAAIEAELGDLLTLAIDQTASDGINLVSRQDANTANRPKLDLEFADPIVQNPTATQASTDCGATSVDYGIGAGDNVASSFDVKVDGSTVFSDTVNPGESAQNYQRTEAEDSSDGSASVAVMANGSQVLAFNVDTDCAAAAATAMLGMSASVSTWPTRETEVEATGGQLQARRWFGTGIVDSTKQSQIAADQANNGNRYAIYSLKPGDDGFTWAEVAAGDADAQLAQVRDWASTLPGRIFITLHHEPLNSTSNPLQGENGSASDWADMLIHACPILQQSANVDCGGILNGWAFSAQARGLSDAELAVWVPQQLLDIADVIAADHYSTDPDPSVEDGADRALRHLAWAKRVGAQGIGMGEFNGVTAAHIHDTCEVLKADPLWKWGAVWNSTGGVATSLEGDRLTEFQNQLRTWPQ